MEPDSADTGHDGALAPDSPQVNPHVTIRNPAPGGLIYDIDPDQLPTETVFHGGRRIFIDGTGDGATPGPEPEQPHYEVIDKISEGGMGIVYRVTENTLKREVALKICRAGLPPDSRRPQEASEFANEAYMTAHLDHPGVVPIYALAKDADGRPFFAMKKVSGTSWKDLLHPEGVTDPARRAALEERARHLSWKDHLQILLKVCDAVAFAHSKAILHRDLKVENIMLGNFGEVYVMDWGLAMYFDERNEYKRFPALKPQLAGTPSYIAPEMVRGEMTRLCPASDVYLLGGMLHEIMTGRPPHDGTTVMDVLKNAATGQVPPPQAERDSPLLTPALIDILMKALAPHIADRYPAVADFQQDLRNYLAHAESMAVCRRATEQLAALRTQLLTDSTRQEFTLKMVDKDTAAICYGQLSECIGGFRQAVELWTGNREARRGLYAALALQIELAIRQDDLTLARAQVRLLEAMPAGATDDPTLAQQMEARARDLATKITRRQAQLDRATRQARRWETATIALGLLLLAGLAAIVIRSWHGRALAIRNEKNMFAESTVGRGQMLEQFFFGIEQIATLYRQSAVELISAPAERLAWSETTAAGRDGYYFDEDFYQPATRPPNMVFNPRYQADISMAYPTIVRAPWARDEKHRVAVEDAARRLGRMNRLFSHIHKTRRDIQWSIAGSEAGLLVGFPGFGRYGDKPDYDPTRRAWYLAAIHAPHDRPVWGTPYADASTRMILMSCMCRIHHDGRNIGVIGVEITLEHVQKMLLDFTRSIDGQRRSLLVQPVSEADPATGQLRVRHRVMVDTQSRRDATDWKTRLAMTGIEEAGAEIAAYYHEVLAGRHQPGTCTETDGLWLAHAPLQGRGWILLSILDRKQSMR